MAQNNGSPIQFTPWRQKQRTLTPNPKAGNTVAGNTVAQRFRTICISVQTHLDSLPPWPIILIDKQPAALYATLIPNPLPRSQPLARGDPTVNSEQNVSPEA